MPPIIIWIIKNKIQSPELSTNLSTQIGYKKTMILIHKIEKIMWINLWTINLVKYAMQIINKMIK
jgi:hypothetical protein